MNTTDEELLQRFLQGDDSAFRELVDRYARLVFAVSSRILRNRASAEDAFQNTFLALAQGARKIRLKRSLASWLYGVAYRVSLRMRAADQRRRERQGKELDMVPDHTLADVTARHELELMDEELNRLPTKYREPLVLHYLLGMSQDTVASELDLPCSTVKGRLQRGRRQLRLRLAVRGVSLVVTLACLRRLERTTLASELQGLVDSTAAACAMSDSVQPAHSQHSLIKENTMNLSLIRYSLVGILMAALAVQLGGKSETVHGQPLEFQSTSQREEPARDVLLLAQAETQNKSSASANLLAYGDGKPDGKRSMAGRAELVRFTRPAALNRVRSIRIHGSRYGYPRPPKEDFTVLFFNEEMTEVVHEHKAPYSLFQRGNAKWVDVRFKQPVKVPETFWVGVNFNAERTKGVYVSYDSSTDGENSRSGLPPTIKAQPMNFQGDWMIRVVLAKSEEKVD